MGNDLQGVEAFHSRRRECSVGVSVNRQDFEKDKAGARESAQYGRNGRHCTRLDELKEHAQKWAAKNLIKGGYMLSNNNYNRAKVNNIEIMKENNCEIIQLSEVVEKYNLSKLPFKRIEGYMISKKVL